MAMHTASKGAQSPQLGLQQYSDAVQNVLPQGTPALLASALTVPASVQLRPPPQSAVQPQVPLLQAQLEGMHSPCDVRQASDGFGPHVLASGLVSSFAMSAAPSRRPPSEARGPSPRASVAVPASGGGGVGHVYIHTSPLLIGTQAQMGVR